MMNERNETQEDILLKINDIASQLNHRNLSIRKNEYELNQYFNAIPIFLFVLDSDQRFERVNRFLCEKLNLSQDNLLMRKITTLISDKNSEEMLKIIKSLGNKNIKTPQIDVEFIDSNGNSVVAKLNFCLCCGGDKILVYGEDITKTQYLNKSVTETFKYKEMVLNNVDSAIIATDLNGKIIEFNKIAEKYLGYRSEELNDRRSLISILNHEKLINIKNKLVRENNYISDLFEIFKISTNQLYPLTFVTSEGRDFTGYMKFKELLSADGTTHGYLGILHTQSYMDSMIDMILASERLIF